MPKRFQFRLETVLDYRRIVEEKAKKEFASAQRRVVEQRAALNDLMGERETGKQALKLLRREALDVVAVRLHMAYLNAVERRIRTADNQLYALLDEEGRRRDAFIESRKNVMVLEKYRDRQKAAYNYELGRDEQKFMDEVAVNNRAYGMR